MRQIGLLLMVMAAPLAAQDDIGISRGTVPTAVEIEDLNGNAVNLARYIGVRPLVVQFWAIWCPLCEELKPRLEAVHRQYGGQVEVLLVAVAVGQSQRAIRRHLDRHPMPFTVLWDTRGRATRAFQAPTTSYVVVLDAEGKVVYTGTGGDQDLEGVVRSLLN